VPCVWYVRCGEYVQDFSELSCACSSTHCGVSQPQREQVLAPWCTEGSMMQE